MECGKVSAPATALAAPHARRGRISSSADVKQALIYLSDGVSALFTEPLSSKSPAQSPHPLCECALLLPPPRAFRWLRRLPVLKRSALSLWRQQIDKLDACGAQLTRATAATASFCLVLAQCDLLGDREAELMRALVEGSYPAVLRAVILDEPTRARSQKLLLPLRVRLLLASFAFQHSKALDDAGDGDITSSALKWTAEVAAKLAEELMEAAVKAAPATKETPSRSRRCEFCRSVDGSGSATRSGGADQWGAISTAVQKCLASLLNGSDQAGCKGAMEALVALRNAIVTSGVSSRDAPTSIRSLSSPPFESLRGGEQGPSPSKAFLAVARTNHSAVTISMGKYEQICRDVLQWAGSRGRANISAESDDERMRPRLESMWALAWQKNLQRRQDAASSIDLAEAIVQCARADAFALAAVDQSPRRIAGALAARLPGCEVTVRVVTVADTASFASIVSTFAFVWAQYDALHRRRHGAVGAFASTATAVQTLCAVYLQHALHRAGSMGSTPEASVSHGRLPVQDQGKTLLESVGCISLMVSGRRDAAQWTDLWDSVLLYRGQSWPGAHTPVSDGLRWCSSIKTLLLAASESQDLLVAESLQRDLSEYCLTVAHGILQTGGAFISSGGRTQRDLIREVADRSPVQQLLRTMLEHFDQEWLCELLVNLLRALIRLTTGSTNNQLLIGMKTLLFPVMATSLHIDSHPRTSVNDQASRDRFVAILQSVAAQLCREEVSSEYVSALLGFSCMWDNFQMSHENESSVDAGMTKWGVQAVDEMGIYPELIERYSDKVGAITREKMDTLMFLSEVLQHASNYPRSMETRLFDLMTRITEVLSANETADTGIVLEHRDRESPVPRISHSSAALRAVFHAASVADAARMRSAVRQLEDRGELVPLLHQLKRWVLMMEGEQDYTVGRESRLEFAVLCNRLLFWAPAKSRGLQLLMSPLDARLVGTLKEFAKLARKFKSPEHTGSAAGISSPSTMPLLVRVEMTVRSYLRGGALPDLCELTTVLVDTIVQCEQRGAREDLCTVVLRHSSALIVECVIAALSKSIKSVLPFDAWVTANGAYQAGKKSSRHVMAASWRAISALETLSSGKLVFGVPAMPWSASLFDETTVSLWLPFFFDFVLGTGLHPASDTLVKTFINSIIVSLTRDDEDPQLGTFRSSYWLVGMLSAVQFANRLQLVAVTGADQVQYETLQSVLSTLLSKLVLASVESIDDEADPAETKTNRHVLVVWQWPMRAGKATIEDDKLWLSDGVQNMNDGVDEAVGDVFFNDVVDTTTNVTSHPKIGVILSFSQWLIPAMAFSQAFVTDPKRHQASPSLEIKSWERTFVHCANELYLPLEFGNCVFSLARTWLLTWISSNLWRDDSRSHLYVLPFQVAWFQRMTRMATKVKHEREAKTTRQDKIFKLVFQTLALAVTNSSDSGSVSTAVGVVLRCIEVVELIDLSMSADFTEDDAMKSGDELLAGIQDLVTETRTLALPSTVSYRLLQCPLELAVFLYVCKLANGRHQDDSLLFLDHLRAVIKGVTSEAESASPSVLDSWQQWGCEMQVKYSCFDRSRCLEVLQIILEVAAPSDDEADSD